MPVSRCRVSYTDIDGVTHAVDVDAESLFEAVAIAVAEFRGDSIIKDTPAPMTEFSVTVIRKPVEHKITFQKVREWCAPSTKGGPAETVKRDRMRKLLAG